MQSIFVKRSRPHHCHRLTSQLSTHTNTSLGQRSLTRWRGPTSSQEMLGQLWAVVVHIVATPCFIYSSKFWHRLRAPHVHICCFATVLSGRRGRIAQVLLWFLSLSSSTGKFSANSVVGFLRKLWLAVLHKFSSQFVVVSTATSRTDHQLPPHEISTRRSTWPKSALKTLTPCYHVLAKNKLVCEPLVGTTFEKLGEHEWRNGFQNMNARVNVTSESALLPLWSGCPPRRSSTGAEPTMLQATWREQAHRARTPLRLTCFAATSQAHEARLLSSHALQNMEPLSRRNASAHHLRQFTPHSNKSVKLRIIKCV